MMRTYPNYGVQLRHRDLFRPINSGRHLLLMLLRQKGQDLSDDRVQSLRYFGLQQKRRVSERDEYLDFPLSSSFSFLTRHSGSTTQPICISFDGERSHSITFTLLTFPWTIVLFNEGKSREFFGFASEREDFFFLKGRLGRFSENLER